MGSPVSDIVADLITKDVEQRALSTYSPFWKRYIDDTCTALPLTRSRLSMPTLTQTINSVHP